MVRIRLLPTKGIMKVFCNESARRASACAVERSAAAIFGEGESTSSGDGSGDGVGDAAQDDIGDGGPIGEVESDGATRGGAIDDEFFARSVEDFGSGDGDLDAVVGIRSFRISDGDSASDIEVRAAFCEGA